ncbi:MAG TPA: CHAP domain-containing protein [Rhizomicrobium sp.]
MTAGSLAWMASLAFACALLGGCAATPAHAAPLSSEAAFNAADLGTTPPGPIDDPTLFPDDDGDSAPAAVEGARLQCVPYARAHSNIDLHGNAYTWWDKAAGVYARSSTPVVDSVIALNGYGRHRGHVAVVRRIVSPREIRIDHANWLDDRAIYVNDPVVDVSADNDWSVVKVWNIRSKSWGTRT